MKVLVFDWKENTQTIITHMARSAREEGRYMQIVPFDWASDDQYYVIVCDAPFALTANVRKMFNQWRDSVNTNALNENWGLLG